LKMDKMVTAREDGTLYLADWPAAPIVPQRPHGVLYYAALFALALFMLGSLAITAFFVFFLVLAFL
ncbi:MAG: hypothetical protein ACXVIZ_10060, partial [Halobacteriota archaeon]